MEASARFIALRLCMPRMARTSVPLMRPEMVRLSIPFRLSMPPTLSRRVPSDRFSMTVPSVAAAFSRRGIRAKDSRSNFFFIRGYYKYQFKQNKSICV